MEGCDAGLGPCNKVQAASALLLGLWLQWCVATGVFLFLLCVCVRGGAVGRVCQHCKLDEDMRTWEARLFQLQTKALAAGTQVGGLYLEASCGTW